LSVLPMTNCVVVAPIPARDGSSTGLSGKSFQEQNGDSNENVCVSFSENWSTTRLLCKSPQEMAAFSSPSVSLSREREPIGVFARCASPSKRWFVETPASFHKTLPSFFIYVSCSAFLAEVLQNGVLIPQSSQANKRKSIFAPDSPKVNPGCL